MERGHSLGQPAPRLTMRRGWSRTKHASLRYAECGAGPNVVLLHGGLGDYRSWLPHLALLGRCARVIAYSRRYSHGSRCDLDITLHSLQADADDLQSLLGALSALPVHLVGTSYGALVALQYALRSSEHVRSITLAEPPLHEWPSSDSRCADLRARFRSEVLAAANAAFHARDVERALALLVDGFAGTPEFEAWPARRRRRARDNAVAMQAILQGVNTLSGLSESQAHGLRVPCLVLHGADTTAIHRIACERLLEVVPGARRCVLARVGHSGPTDRPEQFVEAIVPFIAADTPHRPVPADRSSPRPPRA